MSELPEDMVRAELTPEELRMVDEQIVGIRVLLQQGVRFYSDGTPLIVYLVQLLTAKANGRP